MSYVKNQLIQCRECGFEITPGEGILLYKDPKTGDEDWVCCMTCNMGFAGVDYADVHPARYEYDGNEPIHDDNVDNPGARIGE
jgi:predicted RNA-binding Zn-ribbon protein involved in translation (DUF1610 family)